MNTSRNADDGIAPPFRELIGKIVTHAFVCPPHVLLRFENGTAMSILVTQPDKESETLELSVLLVTNMESVRKELLEERPDATVIPYLAGRYLTGVDRNILLFQGLELLLLPGSAVVKIHLSPGSQAIN